MNDLTARLHAALGDAYRIERELGGGGMSRVFVATEVALDRHVVIKVLPPDLAPGLNVDRFRREIQLAAKLQHPHIVPLLSAGAAGGLLYYTMPLIEGESLRAKLAREGELPVAEAIRILTEVADALAYAHAHGLIHRDIKPDNVLLSGKHAVVTDFGVSKALASATGGSSVTSIGVALGTPAYMAPEQAAADPSMDHRADIYALGVLAYELLSGQPPFSGHSAQQVMAAHATQTPQPLTRSRAAVPPALETLVQRCLAKRPADRPQSAGEVLGALEGMATPSGGMTPFSGGARTRRPWVAAGIGAAIIAAGVLAFATLRSPRVAAAGTRSIAVLPFETLGGADTSQSLADGLQDDILTQLTKIGALQVTSRRSVQDYRRTTKSVREIGRELGVRALLTGQVQRAGDRVHVNVQLIEAGSDRQLWADAYDRELTAQHVFAIQDSIAKSVAEALRIELSPAEARAIAETPTENLEALDHLHRGRQLFAHRGYALSDTEAPRAFERAVALDPRFAQAWAGLSQAQSWLIRQGLAYDTTPARRALDRAESLAPDAPETELARGFYLYYAKGEYAAALEQFRAVERARPSDGAAVAAVGYIMRRQGDWRGALERGLRMTALDPRDPNALWDLGGTYLFLRRFAAADRVLERALILAPDYEVARVFQFAIRCSAGDTARAATVVSEAGNNVTPWMAAWMQSHLALLRRDYPGAVRVMTAARPINLPEQRGRLILLALAYHAAGQARAAAAYADSMRQQADADERRLAARRDVFGVLADVHGHRGIADALLGRNEEAVKEGRIAAELNPVSRDATEGPRSTAQLAAIYVLIGNREAALDRLRYLTSVLSSHWRPGPSIITAAVLRLDPLWDPLRGDPRFETLVREEAAREREGLTP
jgi:eukaryotic-like serine/threonine-protein kinase